MINERITECEVGPIFHRPTTKLLPPRVCAHGHIVPFYQGAHCVACTKIGVYRRLVRQGERRKEINIRKFDNYQKARENHFENGGYLLILDKELYGVTDDPVTVRRLRGVDWLKRCDKFQLWNEADFVIKATL